ncbi:DUF305 domain-containing protein [Krasilnikoviella flava]|uniref:Uncharacterized conserved protein, DUF305 family n=1 Tax=Krasilnikoviella flava TaxID=526729 RepID=A0A1T5KBG5_9MICO|nr:DUF305 domain-containing protein [Krasilnikoviella flava]SKC60849.1 Uncharacterized conserved protein, DUF305 family [Krasilnikoviella flava]
MKHSLLARARVPALALAVVVPLAACAADDGGGHDMAGMSGGSSSPSATAPGDPSEAAVNDADVMFAQMMVPHHEQAVEMSDTLLAKDGVGPELVDLAQQIKAAQGPEIETLTGWLADWGADPAPGGTTGHGMGGMMSAEDMQALDDATGADAERLFLEQMVEHHEGAVEMARAEVADGADAGAVEMARSVVDAQTDEIRLMQELLASR